MFASFCINNNMYTARETVYTFHYFVASQLYMNVTRTTNTML